jgi:hypothetical protein
MVSLLLLSKGLRKEDNNEKKRKRVKRNEIQCMILFKSLLYVFNQPKKCFEKGNLKTIQLDQKFIICYSWFMDSYTLEIKKVSNELVLVNNNKIIKIQKKMKITDVVKIQLIMN